MSYQKRIPPIRLFIDKDQFNKIIQILSTKNESLSEELKSKSLKLKEKLLRYSIPRNDDKEELKVDIRFYPNEAEDLLYLLVNNFEDIEILQDYYAELKNFRNQ